MSDITPEQITAVIVALTSLVAAIGAIVSAVYGRSARAHASEASALAGGAKRSADYSVSQNAAMQQTMIEHCGAICPALVCPLRRREEQRP